MKFTIITVCKNAEKSIEKTVKSVLQQSYKDFEYIICDGASTDSTIEIINEIKNKSGCNIRVYCENDFGIYNAMNRGIARAGGEYTIFLNAGDSLYDTNVLENINKKIAKINIYEAIYYGSVIRSNTLNEIIIDYKNKYSDLWKRIFLGHMPCHQSVIANTKFLKEHYFNEKYKLRADFEWIVYCYKKGIPFINLKLLICCYDSSGVTSKPSSKKRQKDETERILKHYYPISYRVFSLKSWFI